MVDCLVCVICVSVSNFSVSVLVPNNMIVLCSVWNFNRPDYGRRRITENVVILVVDGRHVER